MKPTFWTGLCFLFLNVALHLSPSSQNTETNHKNIDVYVEVKEGKKIVWLDCPGASENDTVWRKNGVILSAPLADHKNWYPLSCIKKSDEGNYTCHNSSQNTGKLPLQRSIVKVLERRDYHPCGKPNKDLIQEFMMCPTNTRTKFQCCKIFGPPPDDMRVSIDLNQSYEICNLYGSLDQPWKIKVFWEVPYYGNDDVWGWQISLLGLQGDVNYQECVQINSKNELLNWNFSNVVAGATYRIAVESLPSGYGDSDYKPNSVAKEISIPSWKDMCNQTSRKCKWEICVPVKNLTVTEQDTTAPVVSWLSSEFYKSPHDFLVYYRGTTCSDSGTKRVKNGTQVILNDLARYKCHAYFVKVLPIFNNTIFGTYSEEVVFYANISHPTPVPPGSNMEKILISSIVALSVLLPVLTVCACIYIMKRKRPSGEHIGLIPTPDAAVKVFIVYNSHCKLCDNVPHVLGKVLNSTEDIECILDMWTNEISKMGCAPWYEKTLQCCDKVLFMSTDKDQKISNPYVYVKKMIMGKDYQKKIVDVVTVGFDDSPDEDLPPSLGYRLHFKIPSEIDRLCFNLNPAGNQSFHDYISKYSKRPIHDELKRAIARSRKCRKAKKGECSKWMPPTSSSEDEYRV